MNTQPLMSQKVNALSALCVMGVMGVLSSATDRAVAATDRSLGLPQHKGEVEGSEKL